MRAHVAAALLVAVDGEHLEREDVAGPARDDPCTPHARFLRKLAQGHGRKVALTVGMPADPAP